MTKKVSVIILFCFVAFESALVALVSWGLLFLVDLSNITEKHLVTGLVILPLFMFSYAIYYGPFIYRGSKKYQLPFPLARAVFMGAMGVLGWMFHTAEINYYYKNEEQLIASQTHPLLSTETFSPEKHPLRAFVIHLFLGLNATVLGIIHFVHAERIGFLKEDRLIYLVAIGPLWIVYAVVGYVRARKGLPNFLNQNILGKNPSTQKSVLLALAFLVFFFIAFFGVIFIGKRMMGR